MTPLLYGLQVLASYSFPKKCATCGTVYKTAEEFLKKTESVAGGSGLKASTDDDGTPLVEVFRNCPCGSTLMEYFGDRRNTTDWGKRRRKQFNDLLQLLYGKGIEPDTARRELLKVVRGEKSELLRDLVSVCP